MAGEGPLDEQQTANTLWVKVLDQIYAITAAASVVAARHPLIQ
jgi:hypothetical protein